MVTPGQIMVDTAGLRLLSTRLGQTADIVADQVRTIDRVPPPTVDDYGSQLLVDKMGRVLRTWSSELAELREAVDQMSRNAELAADEAQGTDHNIADELRPSELGLPEGRWLPGLPDGDQSDEPSPSEPDPPRGEWLPGEPD